MAIRLLLLFLNDNTPHQALKPEINAAVVDKVNLRARITHGLEPFHIIQVH